MSDITQVAKRELPTLPPPHLGNAMIHSSSRRGYYYSYRIHSDQGAKRTICKGGARGFEYLQSRRSCGRGEVRVPRCGNRHLVEISWICREISPRQPIRVIGVTLIGLR